MRLTLVCVEPRSIALYLCAMTAFITPLYPQIGVQWDSVTSMPQLLLGVTQIASTSVFYADLFTQPSVGIGSLSLRQRYRGASLLTGARSFRDDESMRVDLRIPISNHVDVFPQVVWDLSSDSRSLGIARMERLRLAGGAHFNNISGRGIFYTGAERAIQLNVREAGAVIGGQWHSTINLGDFEFDAYTEGEYVKLNYRRNNDITVRLNIFNPQPDAIILRMNIEHTRQRRDYYTTLGITPTIALEHRFEQKWLGSVHYEQSLGPLRFTLFPIIQILTVDRYFDQPIQSSSLTYVSRQLHELDASIEAYMELHTQIVRSNVTIAARSRHETNLTNEKFIAQSYQLVEDVRQSERMRDNASLHVRTTTSHTLMLGRRDTLIIGALASIIRYDTPSTFNYDDRDELTLNGRLIHIRTWSPILRSVASIEYAAIHFVFLRAQRSALNNWNRTLRVSNNFAMSTPIVGWYPGFEILAQYTTYDFEGIAGVPSSFSFRQLSYRDSMVWQLVPSSTSIRLQVYARWFLRGDFSFQRFAEYPTGTGVEYFFRPLIMSRLGSGITVGVGARWYWLQQTLSPQSLALLGSSQWSIAPDIEVHLQINQLDLSLNGWYESRTVSSALHQHIPNVQFSVRRRF